MFTVTVVNTPQPTINCAANQTAVAASGATEAAVSVPTPTYTGAQATIGDVNYPVLSSARSDQRAVSDPYPIGVTNIIWTVRDQYGSSASCTQKVTVTSADSPTITCPADQTFTANAGDCQMTLTAAQIGTPVTGGAASPAAEPCPVGNPCAVRSDHLALTDAFPAGQTAITWTATNAVGSVSCTQTITIHTTGDTTPPTLTIPADINIATSDCSVLLDDELGVASATDNCTPAITVTRTGLPQVACPIPGNPTRICDSFYFPTGTTNITYTATDAAGNTATGVQHINIAESPVVLPTITAPTDLTGANSIGTGPGATSCSKFVSNAVLGSATASDNCPGVIVTSTGVPTGNVFPVGDTYITYTATDRTGHTASATQKVTVVDTTAPVVTLTGANPMTVECHTGFTDPGATANDNCAGNVTSGISVTGSVNANVPGTYTLTYSVGDGHGNTGTAARTVNVVDTTVPTTTFDNLTIFFNNVTIVFNTNSVTINGVVHPFNGVNFTDDDGRHYTFNGQTVTFTVNGHSYSYTFSGNNLVLWTPTHQYQTVKVADLVASAADTCDTGLGLSNVVIKSVSSDEPQDISGGGDGNTLNDIVIAADCKSVQLRAERNGNGNGRVYTITFRVRDASGNTTTTTSKLKIFASSFNVVDDGAGAGYTVNSSCNP
jgi:hypothetical protein